MREFTLSIVSAERTVVEEMVISAVLPGFDGYFGVMRGHVPLVAELKPGVIEYTQANGNEQKVSISGGFAEVLPDRTIILANTAELAQEVDVDRARLALDHARKMLSSPLSEQEMLEARTEFERARARLKAAGERVD